jgi:hypothetical protein
MITKRCRVCKQDLPVACFQRDPTRPDNLNQRCRNCQAVWMSGYWKYTYYPANKTRLILNVLARRAKPRD